MNSHSSGSASNADMINRQEPLAKKGIDLSDIPEWEDSAQQDSNVEEAEKAEDLFGFARTVEVDLDQENIDDIEEVLHEARRYYIQGIVQGQHAFLITNLLGGESRTLLQPQMVWTIGRNRQAALPLADKELSRRHAVIQYVRRQGFYLIDLNSTNGSYINQIRVKQRQLLQDGDCVQVARTAFTFFVSNQCQTVEPIHPAVLTRLNHPGSITPQLDYLELEEPEMRFKSLN